MAPISIEATSEEESVRLLRTAGSFGSRRHQRRGIRLSRAAALIAAAARDLSDYQRLTAEGKLGDAGQRLEALKAKLEQLNKLRR